MTDWPMKKLVFGVVLVAISSGAMAEWTLLFFGQDGDGRKLYLDADTVRWSATNTVRAWLMLDLKTPQKMGKKSFSSVKTLREFDCKDDRARNLSVIFYSGKMGDGESLSVDEKPSDWVYVAPGTLDAQNLNFMCKDTTK
jgi:hypothetical protein